MAVATGGALVGALAVIVGAAGELVGALVAVGDGNCVGALHATRKAKATRTSVWVMNDFIVSSIETCLILFSGAQMKRK